MGLAALPDRRRTHSPSSQRQGPHRRARRSRRSRCSAFSSPHRPRPAQALETAIPNFSFSDTWTVNGTIVDWERDLRGRDRPGADWTRRPSTTWRSREPRRRRSPLVPAASPTRDTYVFARVDIPGSAQRLRLLHGARTVPGPNGLNTAFTLLRGQHQHLGVVLTLRLRLQGPVQPSAADGP